jgi:hypothetical protein
VGGIAAGITVIVSIEMEKLRMSSALFLGASPSFWSPNLYYYDWPETLIISVALFSENTKSEVRELTKYPATPDQVRYQVTSQ